MNEEMNGLGATYLYAYLVLPKLAVPLKHLFGDNSI